VRRLETRPAAFSVRRSGELGLVLTLLLASAAQAQTTQKPKLPKPRDLEGNLEFVRDPASGELRAVRKQDEPPAAAPSNRPPSGAIVDYVRLIRAPCSATSDDGSLLHGLGWRDFRASVDDQPREIAHLDKNAADFPAKIVLLLDSSPSEAHSLENMKSAARSLAAELAPQDQVAVVAFAGHAHVLLPFSTDRTLLAAALNRLQLMREENEVGSNIYRAVYLAAHELFKAGGSWGPEAMILLTDGQDSGLGLSWDPASMQPQPGSNQPAFEDVVRELSSLDLRLFVISTENRPRPMTRDWLAAHANSTLISGDSRRLDIPTYTIYLAELARRVGGSLYFLREIGGLGEAYRRIVAILHAEYVVGIYADGSGMIQPGWHRLAIALADPASHPGAQLACRNSYYVPQPSSTSVAGSPQE
jgi:VWFA-related protein